MNYCYIPDVSHHDPIASWDAIQKNCPFLITKATEGTAYVDPTLTSFILNCEKRKIPYWVYTFLKSGNELAQAQFMVKTCKPKIGDYFVGYILDIERNNSPESVKNALDWLKAQGHKTMLYTQYSQRDRYKSIIDNRGDNCAWWEARYGKNEKTYNPRYPSHDGVDLHQFTENGTIRGINTYVDLNRLTGTKPLEWFTTKQGNAVKPMNKPDETYDAELYSGDFPVLPPRGYFKRGDGITTLTNWHTQIKRVQALLNWIDDSTADITVDGDFGLKTEVKLKTVQKRLGIPVTGMFDQATLQKSRIFKN